MRATRKRTSASVFGSSVARSMNSSTVWNPLPRGPRPSMAGRRRGDGVGVGAAADERRFVAAETGGACAGGVLGESAPEASVRSSGTRAMPPRTSSLLPPTLLAASRRRAQGGERGFAVGAVRKRKSTSASALIGHGVLADAAGEFADVDRDAAFRSR